MAIQTNRPRTARTAPRIEPQHVDPNHLDEMPYVTTPNLAAVPGEERETRLRRANLRGLDELVHEAEASVATLTHAAENVENGGLKLLLKVMAAVRATRVKRLHVAAGLRAESDDAEAWAHHRHIADGMTDIQASMSVRREERQHLALYELGKSEASLLDTYDSVLATGGDGLPQPVLDLLREQRDEVAAFHGRLSHLDEERAPLVVARVYPSLVDAEAVAAELHRRGLARNQVDILPLAGAMVRAHAEVTKPAGTRSTVVAGAVTGGTVGGVIGLALAFYILQVPEWIGWLTVGPLWLFLGTLIPAALMGAAFGWLIGQNRKEDDRNVAVHHMTEGECLVAAYPNRVQMPGVERVLQIHHARSLGA